MQTRNTKQKQIVLNVVKGLNNHPTAQEIYNQCLKLHNNIGQATVYRNLNHLAKTGEILKIEIPNGSARFDHTLTNHYHHICKNCGEVNDLQMAANTNFKIDENCKFKIETIEVIFSGICEKCLKNKEKQNDRK